MTTAFTARRGLIRPVKTLSAEAARKIAAGEVIDRPNAVIRELLDNAIDAGSFSITASLQGGGIESISISDDGIGLSKEDLLQCAKPHATSKIQSEVDLLNLSTLGFRGEALASIASVSRLEITSRRKEEEHAWRLRAEAASENILEPAVLDKGTIVQSSGLFENFPARRAFLKRPSAEGNLCRLTFIEKTVPFPEIAFRLILDGEVKLILPSCRSKKERFTQAYSLHNETPLFSELTVSDPSAALRWTLTIVIGDSSVTRTDRKNIHVYVNNRKINEYSLIQAVEYGCEGYFPNGLHPVCCLFLEIDPSLVDFNIHPAKKEARFKDLGAIHHALSTTLRSFFRSSSISQRDTAVLEKSFFPREESSSSALNSFPKSAFSYSSHHTSQYGEASDHVIPLGIPASSPYFKQNSAVQKLTREQHKGNYEVQGNTGFTYLGSFQSLFLLAEREGKLYVIDQHAGHERILFDRFMNQNRKQELLIPFTLSTESKEDDEYLATIQDALSEAGFTIAQKEDGKWEITSINSQWQGTALDLEKDILEKRLEPADIMRSLAASNACRSAVKDGNFLDSTAAVNLITDIFSLEDPHCPHGRPVWTVITREELFERVQRT